MTLSPEALSMLENMSRQWVKTSFAMSRRAVFDSIYTPMNVWKKQFTSPLFRVRIRMPQRFLRAA